MGSVVFPAYSVSTAAVLVIVRAVAGNHALVDPDALVDRSSLGSVGRVGRVRGLDPRVDPV
jgi:hypothetical protein